MIYILSCKNNGGLLILVPNDYIGEFYIIEDKKQYQTPNERALENFGDYVYELNGNEIRVKNIDIFKKRKLGLSYIWFAPVKKEEIFIEWENEKTLKIIVTGNIDLLTNETNIENVPKIMYVTSKEGLNRRSEPSINGDITGVLLYGERVITHEKSETVDTINGITEYWYRVKFHVNINEWIFGGYVSENLPSDLPIILGKWDNIERQRETFVFSPNHDYMNGLKETSNGIWGSWELNKNNIRIFNLRAGLDYLAVNGKLANDEENIKLEIKNDNNIVLIFSGGRVVELIRSSDLW